MEQYKPPLRNKTESQAKIDGMHYSHNNHCPECGCAWYGNKNYCGDGHRTCYDCLQEYWIDIEYSVHAERREIPS